MKIAILSGGSGNDTLIKGLKKIYKNVDVKVIVNAYDNGKSTGVCRAVTDTLGVSDIRKNHTRMYKAMHEITNKKILEFYDKRFDFTEGKEAEEISNLLLDWDLEQFIPYVEKFFKNEKVRNYSYKDFSVANIIYAQMYKELGYETTNKTFSDLLGIDDFVILNSFDNIFIEANTQDGTVLRDEGDIVQHRNPNNFITSLNYILPEESIRYGLNGKAIEAVKEADLIIISTGTFWSSIFPTLEYLDFYKYINESHAKKIWAMNNNEDDDSYGVGSEDFIKIVEELGLNLTDFSILYNEDAVDILKQRNNFYKSFIIPMENNNGKHNGDKFSRAILKIYYNLTENYSQYLFDFDDTICSRKAFKSQQYSELEELSIDNMKKVGRLYNASIISGNTYDSIKKKLFNVFGTKLVWFNTPIWADVNSTKFYKNEVVDYINEFVLQDDIHLIIENIEKLYNVKFTKYGSIGTVNYKISKLNDFTRNIFVDLLNVYLKDTDAYAIKAGTTTIDIVSKNNNKAFLYDFLKLDLENVLYIGDEINVGNDKEIASKCDNYINVSGVEETNVILNLIMGE